jgi:hypothetical protein
MRAMLCLVLGAVMGSGCGLIADALSDAAQIDIDTDLFPEENIGDEYQQSLSLYVDLSQDNTTYSLPDNIGAENFGPLIAANIAMQEDGLPPVFRYEIQPDFFELTGDGIFAAVIEVYSRDGIILREEGPNEAPVDPAECTFNVDPATDDAATLSTEIDTCLNQWVATNGMPMSLGFDMTLDPIARDASTFTMRHTSLMVALNNVEVRRFERSLSIDGDVIENQEIIKLEDLEVSSAARWERLPPIPDDPGCVAQAGPLALYGTGAVIDTVRGMMHNTYGMVRSSMLDGRDYNYSVKGDAPPVVETSDYSIVRWRPGMPAWMTKTLEIGIEVKKASDAADAEGRNLPSVPVRGAYVVAGHCPRAGVVTFKLNGTARFATEKK